ncbi:MAG: four-carbon acid sugar kinase family protein [Bacillota bacterium]|nr:four-carbon acid sugar kinase family protein [Bacillota bacterium]
MSSELLAAVLADDLTGANATGVLLSGLGLRVAVELERGPGDLDRAPEARPDVLVLPTESRLLPADRARRAVARAAGLALAERPRLFGKRIDSTLRGNLGAEIDAALEAWQGAWEGAGRRPRALVVAAYPASGRTVRDGLLYVHGRLLEETEVAVDPRTPVHRSDVAGVIGEQSRRPVAQLRLEAIRGARVETLAGRLERLAGQAEILVADAETDEEIDLLAEAVHLLEEGGSPCGPFLLVDPGPAFAARVRVALEAGRRRDPVLVVAGSVAPLALEQLDELAARFEAPTLHFDAARFLGEPEACGRRAAGEVEGALRAAAVRHDRLPVVVVRTARREGDRLDLAPEQALQVTRGLGELVRRLAGAAPVGGLVLTGGEVTAAVCRALGARRLELLDAVEPLAVHARLVGGLADGLPLCTKGGLVGDRASLVRCVRHLAGCPSARRPGAGRRAGGRTRSG